MLSTIPFLNTPFNNPSESEEIEVVDPAHPLFGRKFRLLSRHPASPAGADFVLVAYRDTMQLKLAVPATSLAFAPLFAARTKFTTEAIEELLSLVKECESSCCESPKTCGGSSRKRSARRSPKVSSPSSRR